MESGARFYIFVRFFGVGLNGISCFLTYIVMVYVTSFGDILGDI